MGFPRTEVKVLAASLLEAVNKALLCHPKSEAEILARLDKVLPGFVRTAAQEIQA